MARLVEIDLLSAEEGTLFLLRRANFLAPEATLDSASEADRTSAEKIVQEMDGLPLALDQAGAYIEETRCGLPAYLDLYHQGRTRLLNRRGGVVADHPAPVATTWSLSFQKVEQANPAAADLLRVCAHLSPEAIPEELIIQGAPDLGPVLQAAVGDPFAFNAAVGELLRYSLIGRDPTAQTVAVHRLVQAVLKDEMDEDEQRQWAQRTVKAVNRVFPAVTFETWPQCERYLPQALACETLIREWNLSFAEAARLLNRAGGYLNERGRYPEALPLFQRALAICEQELGPHHPDTTTIRENYASLLKEIKRKR
jgi:tetratricopeptide (TPR) repeat protein